MKPVLVDTGFIVALLDRSETHHEQCVGVVSTLRAALITCEPVIAESCYLVRNLAGASEAVLENVRRGNFLLPYRIEDRAESIQKLIKKYSDVPMDLADACLVDLAGQYATGRVLTLDTDFQFYRWSRNRPFDPLLSV